MSAVDLRAAHRRERQSLLVTLRELGPDVPTLCPPWTASSMAAHLVLSERGRGLVWASALPLRRVLGARVSSGAVERLQPAQERLMQRLQQRGWPWLLDRLAAGPPAVFRLPTLGGIRLLEDWIHHEDVRRANGMGPRAGTGATDRALVAATAAAVRFPEFAVPRRDVEASFPDGTVVRLGATPTVRVSGPPGEVALFLAGRTTVAEVELRGDPDDVARLRGALAI